MNLFSLSLSFANGFEISVHWLIFVLAAIAITLWFFVRWKYFGDHYSEFEIDEVQIGIGKHKIKIKPSSQDLQIAYQLWVELSTRKTGIKIDSDNDVISELYNSWYDFFSISRELLKSIPVKKVRSNESTKEIIDLSFKILNEAIRPHLTTWQAKYRKWYENEVLKTENIDLSPQQIQQLFPQYKELESDMQRVNKILISYKDVLEKLINVT